MEDEQSYGRFACKNVLRTWELIVSVIRLPQSQSTDRSLGARVKVKSCVSSNMLDLHKGIATNNFVWHNGTCS